MSEKARYQEKELELRAQYYTAAENWKKTFQEDQDGVSDENAEDGSDDEADRKFPPAESMPPLKRKCKLR